MTDLNDFLKPFGKLEDLLKGLFVLTNYTNLSIVSLTTIINKVSSTHISVNDALGLNQRLNAFPEIYGKNFFAETNLKELIDSIVGEENCNVGGRYS